MVSTFIKVTIPNYLSGLPIPDTFKGWTQLTGREWLQLLPPAAVVGGITFGSYYAFTCYQDCSRVNKNVRQDLAKVVDFVDIEDIADKAVLCRCWKTKNWPYCDGSHAAHNGSTGDNLGPVIVRHKPI